MRKLIAIIVLSTFNVSMVLTPSISFAEPQAASLGLPAPGTMVGLTSFYVPVIAKGLRVHPDNPILFDFIVDTGNSKLTTQNPKFRTESEKLIKYFLAALTIPDDDQWVNLSPYEKDRIIPDQLGQTEMGRDMLVQDYILKQLTASLIYPEKELGREFWGKVYAKAQQLYGSNEVPVNTFNKVWIVADKAKVYVNDNTAFVVDSHLKVMLEEDYLALNKNDKTTTNTHAVGSQIIREVIIPELEHEVNQGHHFANLRQIFHSMILAAWYKKNLKEALLNQVYSNKSKINGVNLQDKTVKDQIYQQYLQAYKKGVFNYIKEDINQATKQATPKKYFSGGVRVNTEGVLEEVPGQAPEVRRFHDEGPAGDLALVSIAAEKFDAAMTADDIVFEKTQAGLVGNALHTVLNPGSADAQRFLQGGYNQDGYGVAAGAVNDGSHAVGDEGNQGYYVASTNIPNGKDGFKSGEQVFVDTVNDMKDFFKRRKPKLIIKEGIGGQHTPFQGVANVFEVIDPNTGKIIGVYELGTNWEQALEAVLAEYNIQWDEIAVIPSSKSGSTDETMDIFVGIFKVLLEKIASKKDLDGKVFAKSVIDYLHQINFDANGKELPGKELFKGFKFDELVAKINTDGVRVDSQQVKDILGIVLGNMFFETTDRPADSRLSACIRNSGLDILLGENAPGFGAMFDNVGGRWTGDLHMMTFLAFHDLDARAYWQARYQGIQQVRAGTHQGNNLGNAILNQEIRKIAFVVPDELFWFGKATEQNHNESIWQEGFSNLRAIKASDWPAQSANYTGQESLVINLSDLTIDDAEFRVQKISSVNMSAGKQVLAEEFARLFTTFYGMTYTIGTRLIARALKTEGLKVEDIDVNDLNNPATKIMQKNLFLRQPFVELGKGLLQRFLEGLQEDQRRWNASGSGTRLIDQHVESIVAAARNREVLTNTPGINTAAATSQELAALILQSIQIAKAEGRTFVPFIYLEGKKFTQLRQELVKLGIEWVLQGTGDQHISYQQVLANPDQFLPLFISFMPEKKDILPGLPAIGFAKGYLDGISSHMTRHLFAKFSYEALVSQHGKGVFIHMLDTPQERQNLSDAFTVAVKDAAMNGAVVSQEPIDVAMTSQTIPVPQMVLGDKVFQGEDAHFLYVIFQEIVNKLSWWRDNVDEQFPMIVDTDALQRLSDKRLAEVMQVLSKDYQIEGIDIKEQEKIITFSFKKGLLRQGPEKRREAVSLLLRKFEIAQHGFARAELQSNFVGAQSISSLEHQYYYFIENGQIFRMNVGWKYEQIKTMPVKEQEEGLNRVVTTDFPQGIKSFQVAVIGVDLFDNVRWFFLVEDSKGEIKTYVKASQTTNEVTEVDVEETPFYDRIPDQTRVWHWSDFSLGKVVEGRTIFEGSPVMNVYPQEAEVILKNSKQRLYLRMIQERVTRVNNPANSTASDPSVDMPYEVFQSVEDMASGKPLGVVNLNWWLIKTNKGKKEYTWRLELGELRELASVYFSKGNLGQGATNIWEMDVFVEQKKKPDVKISKPNKSTYKRYSLVLDIRKQQLLTSDGKPLDPTVISDHVRALLSEGNPEGSVFTDMSWNQLNMWLTQEIDRRGASATPVSNIYSNLQPINKASVLQRYMDFLGDPRFADNVLRLADDLASQGFMREVLRRAGVFEKGQQENMNVVAEKGQQQPTVAVSQPAAAGSRNYIRSFLANTDRQRQEYAWQLERGETKESAKKDLVKARFPKEDVVPEATDIWKVYLTFGLKKYYMVLALDTQRQQLLTSDGKLLDPAAIPSSARALLSEGSYNDTKFSNMTWYELNAWLNEEARQRARVATSGEDHLFARFQSIDGGASSLQLYMDSLADPASKEVIRWLANSPDTKGFMREVLRRAGAFQDAAMNSLASEKSLFDQWEESGKPAELLPDASGDKPGNPDQALTIQGGIDLNVKNLQLDENGQKIKIKFDRAMIEQFKRGDFSGIHPVILNIAPIPSIRPLLGFKESETEQLAKV